jgi:hypothetical protein
MALQVRYETGLIFHEKNLMGSDFEKQLFSFPSGEHDDMVDAAAYVAILQSRDGLPKNPEEGRKVKSAMSDIYSRLFKKFDDKVDGGSYMSS